MCTSSGVPQWAVPRGRTLPEEGHAQVQVSEDPQGGGIIFKKTEEENLDRENLI